jgi:hypothetical protein
LLLRGAIYEEKSLVGQKSMLSQQYEDNIATLMQKIQEAEAIVVGGAAGMSEAER